MLKFCFSILLLVMVTACASNDVPTYEEGSGYKKSVINEDFIVPINAEQQEVDFDNPNIHKGTKYILKNIGGELGLYPPTQYIQDLEKSGWEELKDKRMGHVQFFQKEEVVMSLVFKEDFFEVFQMEKDAKF